MKWIEATTQDGMRVMINAEHIIDVGELGDGRCRVTTRELEGVGGVSVSTTLLLDNTFNAIKSRLLATID